MGSASGVPGRLARAVWAALAAVTLAGTSAFAAENPMIGAAQRELKRQQFYTGEITNTVDAATKDAARRFQIRHGLKVTGELDGATLAALATSNAPARADSADPQPEADRPPARERSQSIVRDDLDILRELEVEGAARPPGWTEKESRSSANSPRTSSAPGADLDSAAPSREARHSKLSSQEELPPPSRSSQAAPREVIPPQQNYGPAAETAVDRKSQPPTRRESPSPSTSRREMSAEVSRVAQQEGVSQGEIVETVNRFVQSWHQPTPDAELSFYADSVNYFDQGKTAHSAIERDQRNYYRRWPDRDYSLLTKPDVVRADGESATVRYRFRYELRNGSKSARGRAEHFVRFEREGDGLKVVSLRERKITD